MHLRVFAQGMYNDGEDSEPRCPRVPGSESCTLFWLAFPWFVKMRWRREREVGVPGQTLLADGPRASAGGSLLSPRGRGWVGSVLCVGGTRPSLCPGVGEGQAPPPQALRLRPQELGNGSGGQRSPWSGEWRTLLGPAPLGACLSPHPGPDISNSEAWDRAWGSRALPHFPEPQPEGGPPSEGVADVWATVGSLPCWGLRPSLGTSRPCRGPGPHRGL